MPKSKKAIILLILRLSLIALIIFTPLFSPFFNLKTSLGLISYTYKDIDIKPANYNPIETKVYYSVKNADNPNQTLVYYQTYKRNGLFSYEQKPIFNETVVINNYSDEKIKETLSKNDLSITNPDKDNIQNTNEPNQAMVEEIDERNKPEECQDLTKLGQFQLFSLDDFNFLAKQSTYRVVANTLPKSQKDSQNLSFGKSYGNNKKSNFLLDFSIKESAVIKITLEFKEDVDKKPDLAIVSAKKVYSDCRIEEIPLPNKQ